MKKRVLVAVGCVLLWTLALTPAGASAATLTFNLSDNEFSGATAPNGTWTVTLKDVMGGVELNVTNTTPVGTEVLSELYLNFDPALSIANLDATHQSGASGAPTISTDCCKADGDGLYDLKIDYGQPGGVGPNASSSTYLLTYDGQCTFNVSSFNFFSTPAGGHGPFRVAAHVQSIGSNGQQSGWVTETTDTPVTTDQPTTGTTPEPTAVLLLGMGLIAAGRRMRRKVS